MGYAVLFALLAATVAVTSAQSPQATTPASMYTGSMNYDGIATCCALKIMDTDGRVVIETSRQLTAQRDFKVPAIYVKFCTSDNVSIQLWRQDPLDSKKYFYIWGVNLFPNSQQIIRLPVKIELNQPIMLQPEDRLGLFSSGGDQFAIPYDFAPNNAQAYHSTHLLPRNTKFDSKTSVPLSDLAYPRTFHNYVRFCHDLSCSAEIADAARQGAPGVPGPPGPPGPGNTGGFVPVSCDVPNVVGQIITQTKKLESVKDEVEKMRDTLNQIYTSNTVTGTCPTGAIAGSYGVGSCYVFRKELVPYAVAVMNCRVDLGAHLVAIETDIEDRFLRNEILKLSNVNSSRTGDLERYWTSGMYNTHDHDWVWFDDNTKGKRRMDYSHWLGNSEPHPVDDSLSVCLSFDVNVRLTNGYWTPKVCQSFQYYICEIPKKCL